MTNDDNSKLIEMDVDSLRDVGHRLGGAPMTELNNLVHVVAGIDLRGTHYGAFGMLASSLGDAFDQVKLAAHQYLSATRRELSDMRTKTFDTANTTVMGDGAAARRSAGITDAPA
ncbi:hypothetical protein [Nonomuraea rhizosphaerae]|uniref:hypothetical protein n=1 Tax=Nonomuraea rhizosphaerae TaxID=2665663 RepID=UPI001C5E49EF|nr:hypothetical protein [Nonomuraea rhizosphaerae]